MLYEIRVRPNCDPESCHVLRSTFFFPFLLFLSRFHSFAVPRSAVLIGHLFPLWQTEVQQKEQATCAGKNECHSFIHSLSLAFVVVASLCILRMQLSLESGSIVRSCTPSLLLFLPSLALPVRTGQVNYNLHCLSPRSSVCFISLSLSSPPN